MTFHELGEKLERSLKLRILNFTCTSRPSQDLSGPPRTWRVMRGDAIFGAWTGTYTSRARAIELMLFEKTELGPQALIGPLYAGMLWFLPKLFRCLLLSFSVCNLLSALHANVRFRLKRLQTNNVLRKWKVMVQPWNHVHGSRLRRTCKFFRCRNAA